MRSIKTIVCKNCEKESLDVHRNRKVFCDKFCAANYESKIFIEKWLQNDPSCIKGNEQLPSPIRKYLHDLFSSKCQKCKWGQKNETTGKVPLTVNHIDGDCTNNRKDNLELLCPNCHSLTDNYGSLNKGKGRKKRLQKLKQ